MLVWKRCGTNFHRFEIILLFLFSGDYNWLSLFLHIIETWTDIKIMVIFIPSINKCVNLLGLILAFLRQSLVFLVVFGIFNQKTLSLIRLFVELQVKLLDLFLFHLNDLILSLYFFVFLGIFLNQYFILIFEDVVIFLQKLIALLKQSQLILNILKF